MGRQLLKLSILFPLFSCAWLTHEGKPVVENSQAGSTVDPIKLHIETLGSGRPLLMLHGFGANLHTWSEIAKPLARDFRVILVDLKGHGASPKPADTAYSLHDQAELVAQFITERGLHDVILVGHSLGGGIALLVALKLASEAPKAISSLILIDSVAYSQPLPSFIRILRVPVLAQLFTWLAPDRLQVCYVLRVAYFDSDKITRQTLDAYSAPLSLPGARHALIETARQIIPPDIDAIGARYPTLRIPTLLIWGKHDRIVALEVGRRLHRSIPNSELVVIEDAGHVPQEETPEATLAAMQNFLRAGS